MLSKTIKTVLTLCIVAMANSSHALELLDNDAMSASTGQDGITITLKDFSPNMRLNWIDTNGVNDADNVLDDRTAYGFTAPANVGAVRFGDGTAAGNFRISQGDIVLKLDTDAGNGAPFLNLDIQLPRKLTIHTGDIYVAARKNDGSYENDKKIMRDMTIEIGNGTNPNVGLNIQLGNTKLDHFLTIYGAIKDGIQVSNIGIIGGRDINGENGIGITKMSVRDTDSMDLTFNGAGVDLTDKGFILTPSLGKKVNISMQDVKFGNLDTGQGVGDIALSNLAIGNNRVTIVGH